METNKCYIRIIFIWRSIYSYIYIPGLTRGAQELFKMLPYVVAIIVLIFTSIRNKKENQPPAALGQSYFREDR